MLNFLDFKFLEMKKVWLFFALATMGLVFGPAVSGQVKVPGVDQKKAEKKALKEKNDQALAIKVRDLISESNFVLEPNTISGYNVNPVMNFILLAGDTLIFQTSRPVDRPKSNNPLTDKTVFGRVTSKVVKSDNSKGYHQFRLKMMTRNGVGFQVDMKVAPNGNATASISSNTHEGRLDYQGRIVSRDESSIWVGTESFDLTGFPWYVNPHLPVGYDR
jgi:hypothetical protein